MIKLKRRLFLASLLSTIGFVSVFVEMIINNKYTSIFNWILLVIIGMCSIIQWISYKIEIRKK